MKILHVNTADIIGGAARAAYRLNLGLRLAGAESGMLVGRKASSDADVRHPEVSNRFPARAERWLRRRSMEKDFAVYRDSRPAEFEPFADDRSCYAKELLHSLTDENVINLHWVSGFVDYLEVLPEMARRFPLVWTLHDMNPFTGGCHYASNCSNYLSKCGKCPQLGSDKEQDLSRAVWKRKKQAFDAIPPSRLKIVSPSRWLADCAKRSSLLSKFDCEVIPYGIPLQTFAPRNKRLARQVFDIPADRPVVLFIADSFTRRKGFQILIDALKTDGQLPHLVSVGRSDSYNLPGLQHQSLGRISDERMLSLVYSAADLLVCPSLEDNLPNTILEALACGTPTVGFNIGGIPDMVRPGITGWLATETTSDSLQAAIRVGLGELKARSEEISKACREVAEQEYSLGLQANRYAKIYAEAVRRLPS